MHDHRDILELAAAAIDFELDPAERARLNAALETCALCRRQASAMRATATILRRPSDIGTPGPVRDVVLGAALRGDRRAFRSGSLVVASLTLMALLGGTVLIVGSRGLAVLPGPSSPALPVPSPSVVATTTERPTPEPRPTPTASPAAIASEPSTVPGERIHDGDIAAMVTDGRLVIRTKPGTEPDSAIFKTKIYPGQRVLVLEGPVEASGYPWFRIRAGQVEGWAAAAGRDGEPWLAPVRNGVVALVRATDSFGGAAIHALQPDRPDEEFLLFGDPGLTKIRQLSWSPDGTRLAFVATPTNGNGTTEVYTVDGDGSNLVQITRNDVDDDSPAWAPDSTRLAVRVDQVDPSTPGDSNVVVTPVAEPGVTILGPGSNPVWSPDGLQLAMTVSDQGSTTLWIQAPDGTDRRQVSTVSVASVRPSWSPDGQSLVISSSGLSVIDAATGQLRSLTPEPGLTPTWSALGKIAFVTTGSASPGVFVVNQDGTGLERISGDVGVVTRLAWSPDGRWLLLGDERGSPVQILDPRAGSATIVADDGAAWAPAWQPRLP